MPINIAKIASNVVFKTHEESQFTIRASLLNFKGVLNPIDLEEIEDKKYTDWMGLPFFHGILLLNSARLKILVDREQCFIFYEDQCLYGLTTKFVGHHIDPINAPPFAMEDCEEGIHVYYVDVDGIKRYTTTIKVKVLKNLVNMIVIQDNINESKRVAT